jgi:hypothetical protein
LVLGGLTLAAQEPTRLVFRVELYGGWSGIDPEDLNGALDTEKDINRFQYGEYYEYLLGIGYIDSFTFSQTGDYRKLKSLLPLGFRVKAQVRPYLALSLGARYFQNTNSFTLTEEHTVIETSGATSLDTVSYAPLELYVRGVGVQAGVHMGQDIGRFFRIEGYLAGGPVWATCGFAYDWSWRQKFGDSGVLIPLDFSRHLEGSGGGMSLEGGIQLHLRFSRRVNLFVQGSYIQQAVTDLSGPGGQTMYGNDEEWEGRIGFIGETHREPWGTREFLVLNNNWRDQEELKKRNMRLDLSGFSLSLGLSFRL